MEMEIIDGGHNMFNVVVKKKKILLVLLVPPLIFSEGDVQN